MKERERERESERGSETETRERGIWEVVEAGLRVVKSQPMGETFFFFPSGKILLKPGVGEWRERFVPSDCSQGQCTLGGKWKLTNTAPKLRRGREGRKSCEIRSPLQGEGCPCPALHLQWFFLYSIISAQIPHKSPEPLCSFTVRFL